MQALFTILGVGGIYALIACGLVLVYRTSRVVNLSQGQIAIFCVYCAAFLVTSGQSWYVSAAIAVAAGAVAGIVIHLTVMRRILGEAPFVGLMTSIGIAVFVNGLIVTLFGGRTLTLAPIAAGTTTIADAHVPTAHLLAMAGSWIAVAALIALNSFTRLGLLMRAVTADVVLAAQRGVSVDRVVAAAWIVALAAAALAGLFFGQRALISTAAAMIGVNGLIAALIGGMDSLKGAVVGALIVAGAEYATVQLLSARYADMVPALLMLAIVTARPWGLFGTAEEVERV